MDLSGKDFGIHDYSETFSPPRLSNHFEGNIMSYLSFSRVIACGGSWMVKSDLISGGNFQDIKRLSQEATAAIKKDTC